jgi:hypothetical protein
MREWVPSKPSFLFYTKMKLIPYYYTEKVQNSFTIGCLCVFLAHAGKSVWCSEDSDILSKKTILEDYCEPNGFFVKTLTIVKDTAYIEVVKEKMNLSEFYTWEEAVAKPGRPECWRPFFFIKDKEGSDWWSPKGLIEAEIQGYGNVMDLFQMIRKKINDGE